MRNASSIYDVSTQVAVILELPCHVYLLYYTGIEELVLRKKCYYSTGWWRIDESSSSSTGVLRLLAQQYQSIIL